MSEREQTDPGWPGDAVGGQGSVEREVPGEQEGDLFAVRIVVNREQARRLTQRPDLDFGDRPHVRPRSENSAVLEVFASRAQIEELRGEGLELEIGENVSESGRLRQAEVGQGDRFEGGRVPPRGLGRKIQGSGPDRRPEAAS